MVCVRYSVPTSFLISSILVSQVVDRYIYVVHNICGGVFVFVVELLNFVHIVRALFQLRRVTIFIICF